MATVFAALGGSLTALAQPTALLVEDDFTVARAVQRMLDHVGVRSEHVVTGEEALEYLADHKVDLVILDQKLPGMDGVAVLEELHQDQPELDVVVMSGHADMEGVLKALSAGASDYLVKPFEAEELTVKVQRALRRRQVLAENSELIQHLQQANEKIEQMNQQLESKVSERTRQLEEANERLQALSITDDVTGLYNQRYLFNALQEEFERQRRYGAGLAVLMMDLDHFKQVNDTRDHLFGSRVLRRVAQVLQTALREIDKAVRYGGDEFVVLLPHTNLAEALTVSDRLRRTLSAADVGDDDDSWHVTVSVGVASLGECAARSPRELLEAADEAMYLAKSSGRNRVAVMSGKRAVAIMT